MGTRRAALVVLGLGVAVAGAAVAHFGHVRNDAVRHETSAAVELLMVPSGEALDVGSLGYAVHLADLMWVRSVLMFGERFAEEPDPDWQQWLARMLDAVTVLDPQWRTPYFYGGSMLRVTGDVDASTALFEKGHAALPDDFFFPFAIGMNYYLDKEDPVQAAEWVQRAAGLPGAPKWYRAAARGFLIESAQRQVAIRFLREELELTTDPELREPLEARLLGLMHEEMVDKFDGLIATFQELHGRPPAEPRELLQVTDLPDLPPDPLGGTWTVDVDGRIRSTVDVEDLTRRARDRERQMLLTHKLRF